jgi:4-amino-4-deoxy-L-arabinose transferase-like glycosyltransferase
MTLMMGWAHASRFARALAAILLLAVVSRVAIALVIDSADPSRFLAADSAEYTDAADALRKDGRFTYSTSDDRPQFVRTPGYPAFIAGIGLVFPGSELALVLAQSALSGLTVLAVGLLGRRLWSPAVGLIAAGIVVVEPLQILTTGTVLTECLHTALLTLFVLFAAKVVANPALGVRWSLLAGVSLGLATLVRPSTYYLGPLVLALVAVRSLRGFSVWRVALTLAAFGLPLIALLGGWELRNHERVDSWRFSGADGINLYLHGAPRVLARSEGSSVQIERRKLLAEVGARGIKDAQQRVPERFRSPGAFYGHMAERGLSIQTDHALALGLVTLAGSARVLGGLGGESVFPYLGITDPSSVLLGIAGFLLVLFYALAGVGAVSAFRSRAHRWEHALLLTVVVYVLVVSSQLPESRFRAPIMPILCCYVTAGIARLGSLRLHTA